MQQRGRSRGRVAAEFEMGGCCCDHLWKPCPDTEGPCVSLTLNPFRPMSLIFIVSSPLLKYIILFYQAHTDLIM